MRPILTVILTLFIVVAFGQGKHLTYINYQNAYYNKSTLKEDAFFESKINEITLKADSTFEFWSRPNMSCFTWREYKGNWKKEKDTILFYDNYEVVENNMKVTYKKSNKRKYHINFFTDKNCDFTNKEIKIQYIYDYNAHLEDTGKTFYINTNSVIEIPFQEIPNHNKLAAIRIEYLLNDKEKRYGFLTENKTLNIKNGDLPNVIGVELIENPRKEIVYRKIKAVIQNNTIIIVSTTKSKVTLPDYHEEIMFENSYALNK
ncbi:MAG TPA: hypothetical protein VK668_00920 [Mucilaginibacter sp.]|nr:hypothetical protein [Mucilaginibacter sp.]